MAGGRGARRAGARHRLVWAIAGALALSLSQPLAAAPQESVMRVPVVHGLEQAYIDVTVFKPPGAGPFPLLVLSHGSPRQAEERRRHGRQRMAPQSAAFVAMGFAVLVPTRRGYGQSDGAWAEGYGPCADPDYFSAGLETARDVLAALDAVRGEPWADPARVVLAGQSAGGFGSVAASSLHLPGLVGVVNFAGGRGSLAPDSVCVEHRLVDAMSRYGHGARAPELWIYSANDRFFRPALARRMHEAFVKAGGAAEFLEAPPLDADGHAYFARGVSDWAPRVHDFLQRNGVLPTP